MNTRMREGTKARRHEGTKGNAQSPIVNRQSSIVNPQSPIRNRQGRPRQPSGRELELGAIIDAYNQVTEKLKDSHDVLTHEIRRLQQQLEEKDRELERRNRLAALGEMAAGVAHEIRNPLGGILLYATMLVDDLKTQPALRGLAEQITSAAHTLDGIVGDILAYASPQEPNRQPVALDALMTEVIDLLKPRWAKVGCSVEMVKGQRSKVKGRMANGECRMANGECEHAFAIRHSTFAIHSKVVAHVEATQVHRALLNVVSNAIDAAGRSGHVWITTHRVGPASSVGPAFQPVKRQAGKPVPQRFVGVSVADDGPGVPESLVDRIFDPFFTTKDSGTGLGLAIVHAIVESHGGRVTVAARPGGGSVFTLLFPAGSEGRRSEGQRSNGE
ncbi:MAG: ATP-binding protein [Phycisphaerae bacterium]